MSTRACVQKNPSAVADKILKRAGLDQRGWPLPPQRRETVVLRFGLGGNIRRFVGVKVDPNKVPPEDGDFVHIPSNRERREDLPNNFKHL